MGYISSTASELGRQNTTLRVSRFHLHFSVPLTGLSCELQAASAPRGASTAGGRVLQAGLGFHPWRENRTDASAGWRLTRVQLGKTGRRSVPTGSLWTLPVLCWQSVVWSPTGGNAGPKIWTRGGTSPLWITHSPSRSGCNDGFRRRREKILSPKEKKQTNRKKKSKKKLGIVSSLGIAGSWAGLQSAAAVTGNADETAVQLIGAGFERRSKRTPSFAWFLDVGLSSSPSATCSYRTAVINSALRQSDSFPSSQAPAIYINWCFEKAEEHVPT